MWLCCYVAMWFPLPLNMPTPTPAPDRISLWIPYRKSGKNPDLGSEGVWGTIVIVNLVKRLARKLRRVILFHFGLVTFRIYFRETDNSSFSCFKDLVFVSMTSKTNTIYLWRHQNTPKNSRKIRTIFEKYCFWESQKLAILKMF